MPAKKVVKKLAKPAPKPQAKPEPTPVLLKGKKPVRPWSASREDKFAK